MNLHGGNIRDAFKKYRLKDGNFIDFSASINPLGFPQGIKKEILNNFEIVLHYPDMECRFVKKAISKYSSLPEDNLLIGNGSMELIFLIARALKPKKALIPLPAFSEYETAVNLSAGKCVFLNCSRKSNFEIKVERILKKLKSLDLIFICNPNNPTGFLFDKSSLELLCEECEKKCVYLVIDEVFMDFVAEEKKMSMLKFAAESKYILVLRSLTKFFALPGLRLGYLAGEKALLKKIASYQPPWSVNSFAQLAGAALLKERAFISRSKQYVFKQGKELFTLLSKIKYINPYPANANFIFCKILSINFNSARLSDYCGKRGVIIRDCSNFRGLDNSFIRVAVRKEEENARLIKVLKELERV